MNPSTLIGTRKMKYLLDTNIISEPMKKKPNTKMMNNLALKSIHSCTSATVWHELWHGVHLLQNSKRKDQLASYLNLLSDDGLNILPFCQKSAEWLANERVHLKEKGLTPSKYDSEIAAVAYVNQLIIITHNVDDFKIFDGLHVQDWFGE